MGNAKDAGKQQTGSFTRCAVEFARQRQCVVPHPPCAAKLDGQALPLGRGRVEADASCVQHILDVAPACLTYKELPYIPMAKARGFTARGR